MAVSPRPRTFTERPSSVLLPRTPANDDAGTLNPQGSMRNGVFRFASPEAEEQWVRAAYQAGVNADAWQLGDEVDDETAGLILAGLGGPAPAIYRGPDGKYRAINQKTIETAAVRDHRNKHLVGKTIDQIAATGKLPGENEWIEQWRAARVANANQPSSNPKGAGASPPNHSAFEPQEERPGLAKRFEAAARRAIVDETVFGNVYQQFASGHAVSPDVLATRPSDRFLQLGSHGILEWHRMFEPLGIAGGKRRIDFLSPQERRQWETMWEAMPAEQQAAYRGMWEEKQKSYRPWREKFERETNLPPPETITEVAADIAGSIAGSMASPESWIGILPRTPAQAARAAVQESSETLATSGGGLVRASGKSEKPIVANAQTSGGISVDASLPKLREEAVEELGSPSKLSSQTINISDEISRLLPNQNTGF